MPREARPETFEKVPYQAVGRCRAKRGKNAPYQNGKWCSTKRSRNFQVSRMETGKLTITLKEDDETKCSLSLENIIRFAKIFSVSDESDKVEHFYTDVRSRSAAHL